MTPQLITAALSLPYSIGSQRLLREILSSVTGVPLPLEPQVSHGPVEQVRGVRRALHEPAPARHQRLLKALRRGPVTEADGLYDWYVLISDVGVLRSKGWPVRNAGDGRRGIYVLDTG